jgi:nitrite reductase/ring-hydroxylating ferredoxin subunit
VPAHGLPLERGCVEDGILTCHWHHARFDLESGCTFDLWGDTSKRRQGPIATNNGSGADAPELRDYMYVKMKDQVLIVNGLTNEIVDMFSETRPIR